MVPEYHYRAKEDAGEAMTDQDEVLAQAAAGMEPGMEKEPGRSRGWYKCGISYHTWIWRQAWSGISGRKQERAS